MNRTNKNSGAYVGYEYKEIQADNARALAYVDGYKNFGWKLEERQAVKGIHPRDEGKTIVRLKRERKIVNKAELTRLQRHFEDGMKQVELLEISRDSKAALAALIVGLAGTVFMAGSTFAVVHEPPVIWLCVILAVPGFAGWILPYFIYKNIRQRRTQMVAPLIEEKYDEIDAVCEKGSHLLEF